MALFGRKQEPASAVGEAPGRLDFMGGVADYSGSLVLEMPIRQTTRVRIEETVAPVLRFRSEGLEDVEIDFTPFANALRQQAAVEEFRLLVLETELPRWTFYPLGCLIVFAVNKAWRPEGGLTFAVESNVPQSMGVSSSAALEVATLKALADLAGRQYLGTELARLGQQAENEIAGAPCGLMDQLTSAYGKHGSLLPVVCQPDKLLDPVSIPEGVVIAGWPSGVKHDVGASPYGIARTATFMGKKVLENALRRKWHYAADIPPSLFHRHALKELPYRLKGETFVRLLGNPDDPLSKVDLSSDYDVHSALRFPVEENFRASLAVTLLKGVNEKNRSAVCRQIGELLYLSHEGYTGLGLGTPETDAMIDGLKAIGPERGVYGGRVSGGGSGGTVAVFLDQKAVPLLEDLSRRVCFRDDGPLPLIL